MKIVKFVSKSMSCAFLALKFKLRSNKLTHTGLMKFVKPHLNGNALAQLQLNL